MRRQLLLIGLGGFGKWVVTAFKTSMLDTYGEKPANIDWLSLDLIGRESPQAKYPRFESGRFKYETLDFSDTSPEFLRFQGNYINEIQRIRRGEGDLRFLGRVTPDDAGFYVLALEGMGPCSENRQISMMQFVLDFDRIESKISSKLYQPNPLIFLVSSWAGGTGTGCFIDCLLLLRKKLETLGGTVISIILMPHGFSSLKDGETMDLLNANCYAAFREFHRLFYPKGNVQVNYSLTNPNYQNIGKPSGTDFISDVVYLVDGSIVGAQPGHQIEYYRGTVPAIAMFIHNSFITNELEEQQIRLLAQTTNQTPFDHSIVYATSNFTNNLANDLPLNAFTYSSFGAHRLIFDSKAVKTELAQIIGLKLFGPNNFLAESWIPNVAFFVKSFLKNAEETSKFDKEIIHECRTKGPVQVENFATYRSLKSRLEDKEKDGPEFPDFNLDRTPLTGKVKDVKEAIDIKENNVMGEDNDDKQEGRRKRSFYAVRNHYREYYPAKFKEGLNRKVLAILSNTKDGDPNQYGYGNLKATEQFLAELIEWHLLFLRGRPDQQKKAEFTLACEVADNLAGQGTYGSWSAETDAYYHDNKKRFFLAGGAKRGYREMRVRLYELKARDLMRSLVAEVAAENLTYINKLYNEVRNWIYTFELCQKTIQKSLSDLRVVRIEKKDNICDEYITDSSDAIEKRLYDIVTDFARWDRVEAGRDNLDRLDQGMNEIIHKVPNNSWADFLNGFHWGFNQTSRNGEYYTNKHSTGDLVCFVEMDEGMPEFPNNYEVGSEEYLQAWNYDLIEYFLTKKRLNLLDEITAFEVLMLRGDKPEDVFEDLNKKSEIMLTIDDTKSKHLESQGYANFRPENRFSIIADFNYDQNQVRLRTWITGLEQKIKATIDAANITIVNERTKPQEIVLISQKSCLAAPSIVNLASNQSAYKYRLDNQAWPPLHLLNGEKEAYHYETEISKEFRSNYEELHPQIITILEKKDIMITLLWAKLFDFIKEGKTKVAGPKKLYFKKDGEEKVLALCDGEIYYSDVIYEFIYPLDIAQQGIIKQNLSILEQMVDVEYKVLEKDTDKFKALREDFAKSLKEIVKDNSIPQREKDLYKVWSIMINE